MAITSRSRDAEKHGTGRRRCRSPEETANCGARLAAELVPGDMVALHGELGAGKTTFARGVARALGITEPVTSPTFTLVQEYELPCSVRGIRRLCHLDLYRMTGAESAIHCGVAEYFEDREAVLLIEWPERLGRFLPHTARQVWLRHGGPRTRLIELDYEPR